MVKHTQTNCHTQMNCLSVFDHFVDYVVDYVVDYYFVDYFSEVEGSESSFHIISGSVVCVPGADPNLETESWVLDLSSKSLHKFPWFDKSMC